MMIRDWIQYITEIQHEQELSLKNGTEFYMPFIATSITVVKTVFTLAEYFNLHPRTKYLSLYLFDKYMCNKFWEIYKKYENDAENNTHNWNQVTDKFSNEIKLRLMSCIQLASKVDSHYKHLGIAQIIAGLQLMSPENNEKVEYSPNTIFKSEIKVFKTLNYRIPSITPLDCLEVLLVALGLRDLPKFYESTISILDLTFLQHQNLYGQLQLMIIGSIARTKIEKITFMTMEIDMLFLSASIIVCTLFFFNVKKERQISITEKLAELIDIKHKDIYLMATTIFELARPN
ncbi:cyclin N-terminal domain-containing protein 1-like isoform X2 [Chelonus insularis]|nr:cyclin N-terminal domain-containing protein 1-like isoform X2 [Chelonus insularis]